MVRNVGFFWVFWFFEKKRVESTFLNIPDDLRQSYFIHFFNGISSGLTHKIFLSFGVLILV